MEYMFRLMFGQIMDHKENSFILIKDYENYVSCEVFTRLLLKRSFPFAIGKYKIVEMPTCTWIILQTTKILKQYKS